MALFGGEGALRRWRPNCSPNNGFIYLVLERFGLAIKKKEVGKRGRIKSYGGCWVPEVSVWNSREVE